MPNVHGKRILVVDDSKSIRSMVVDYLKSKGYDTVEASDGIQGLNQGLSSSFNVIILDVNMPHLEGFRVCQILREKGVKTPIIMLTERSSTQDKVTGFSFGADDYLAKPFDLVELDMRIQALIRRSASEPQSPEQKVLKHGDLEIDIDRHTVKISDRHISLTPIEFNILMLLASTPGHVYSRQDLLSVIWDTAYEGYKRNIDPHVNRLRTKIEENPKKPKYVLTIWGKGYKFNETL